MTWTRILTTGSGVVAWRVSIDGWPFEFVSHKGMAQTVDGRERVIGLRTDGMRFAETVELSHASWTAEGFTVTVADKRRRLTECFAKRPTAVTYLDEPSGLNASDTTFTVKSTAAFPSSGHVFLNTEAIEYSGKTATTFTGCTRGAWNTLAQYHYSPDGDRLRYPEVSNLPQAITGRRVRVYAYGSGDSLTGNGTQVWIGVASAEADFSGAEWSFRVDALSRLLDTDIGADLEEPTTIRGIYLPATAPIFIRVDELSGASFDSAPLTSVEFAMAGFWETQREWCDALTDELSTQMTAAGSFTQTVIADTDGDRWCLWFTTAVTPHWMNFRVQSAVDGDVDGLPLLNGTGRGVSSVSAGSYKIPLSQGNGLGSVPRAVYGAYSTSVSASRLADANRVNINATTYPQYRLYLANGTGVTSNTTSVSAEWTSTGNALDASSEPFTAAVDTVDTTDRAIVTVRPETSGHGASTSWYATAAGLPEIRMGRNYGAGTLADFLSTLSGQTAQYLNTGAVPDFRSTDYDAGEIASVADYTPLTSGRAFTVFAEVSLKELIEHECRLLGVYPCLDTNGKITFRKLRLPSPGEVGDTTLTKSIVITDDNLLSYEQSAEGLLNTFLLRTGYDPVEDDHKGTTVKVRDVAAYGLTPNTRAIECAPKSRDPASGVNPEDVISIAQRVLSVFGAPYAYLTVEVPLTRMSTLLGSAIGVTWAKVPNSTGGLGVTDKIGLVIGRDFAPMEGKGSLTILLTDQRVGGYVPSAKIDSINGASGGTSFTLTLDSDYFPAGTTAGNFWETGDLVRLYRWGSTSTTGNVTATVGTAVGSSVTVTTDSAWNHTGITWAVGSQVSTSITAAGQKRFVYEAGSDMGLDWSGDTDNPPFTFA